MKKFLVFLGLVLFSLFLLSQSKVDNAKSVPANNSTYSAPNTDKVLSETPTPTPSSTVLETPSPTSTIAPTPDYYINSDGNQAQSPTYSDTVPPGATAICNDGTYSFSQHRRGTCSHHGGVAQWL